MNHDCTVALPCAAHVIFDFAALRATCAEKKGRLTVSESAAAPTSLWGNKLMLKVIGGIQINTTRACTPPHTHSYSLTP